MANSSRGIEPSLRIMASRDATLLNLQIDRRTCLRRSHSSRSDSCRSYSYCVHSRMGYRIANARGTTFQNGERTEQKSDAQKLQSASALASNKAAEDPAGDRNACSNKTET